MKSFVIKGTIFAVIVAVVTQIFNYGYLRTNPDFVNKFRNVPDNIEVCNVGASFGDNSFNYEDFNDRVATFNFANSDQSYYYDYQILDNYKNNLSEGCVVFIVLSYPMFIGKCEVEYDNFEQKNLRYYYFLPPDKIRNYSLKTDIKLKLASFIRTENFGTIVKGLMKETIFYDGWLRKTSNEEIADFIEDEWYSHFINNKVIDGNTVYLQEAVDNINKIIDLCINEKWQPVLILTPLTQDYKRYINAHSRETIETIYEIIRDIQRNTGVDFYDYSDDQRFCENIDLFCNGDHLNKEGARKFTDIVMTEIAAEKTNIFY